MPDRQKRERERETETARETSPPTPAQVDNLNCSPSTESLSPRIILTCCMHAGAKRGKSKTLAKSPARSFKNVAASYCDCVLQLVVQTEGVGSDAAVMLRRYGYHRL